MEAKNSLNIFLKHELNHMQKLLIVVRTSLSNLKLAIEGVASLNEVCFFFQINHIINHWNNWRRFQSLQEILDKLYNSRIPEIWLKFSWQSSTLGFWFNELLERDVQYKNWLNSKPKVFWMNGFFNPQGFLTAMKQEVARKKETWPLDKVSIYNTVLKNHKEDIKDSPMVSNSVTV